MAELETARQEFAKLHSQRFGQQYGTLLAGYAALIADKILNSEEIANLVAFIVSPGASFGNAR